jgi:histidine triad (HIT) family protein
VDCIFCQIAEQQVPANIIYEDDYVVAFDDLEPQAPEHKLIIPRIHISTVNDLTEEHKDLIGHMFLTAKKIAHNLDLDEDGYRLVMNCQPRAGQSVFHIHLHVLAGRQMQWPPG